jgi:hypothetical protein
MDGCDGILDGNSQAMRQQVWRPHLVHELLVKNPASVVFKTFSFHKKHIAHGKLLIP